MAGDIRPAQRATIQSGRPRDAFDGKCGSMWEAPLSLSRYEHQAVLLELIECGVRVVTLSATIRPDFPGSAMPSPQTSSSALSDWARQEHNPLYHLTNGPTAIGRGEAR